MKVIETDKFILALCKFTQGQTLLLTDNDNHTIAMGCGWAGLFLNYLGDSITAKFTGNLSHLCRYCDLATR